MSGNPLHLRLRADSFLEYAFLRWVLGPATRPGLEPYILPQSELSVNGRSYRLDYEIRGSQRTLVIELDGFAHHSQRDAFTYDRLRQNDIQATERTVIRFSYEAIRSQTRRCVQQMQAFLASDPALRAYLEADPVVEMPDMAPDPLHALDPAPGPAGSHPGYFDRARGHLNLGPLRRCQYEAFVALANYFRSGGRNAACVMAVGAGKTALGVAACLGFARRRALVVTPGSVIRGTFDRAFDPSALGNALNQLAGGPLIPGCPPPTVVTLEADEGSIRDLSRAELLDADVIITNFHALGSPELPDSLLAKLRPEEVDLIVVDEAHIAAADSYQRLFRHFGSARTVLMSACFQRMDGRPIEADVVYRYRLIDSIADGNAKRLRVHRYAPDPEQTLYEIAWPDGRREEVVGREALLEVIEDERRLAHITAKSPEPIRRLMETVRHLLDRQALALHPVKPRVLFSALGERHAEQLAALANEAGIPCTHLHHSMGEARVKAIRQRFEQDSGDLQGIVQLKMLGQGYDFPPIAVVVPMRPYGSFAELYQFVGRGIRVIRHTTLEGRAGSPEQALDLVYHAELGLDAHLETLRQENEGEGSFGQLDTLAEANMPNVPYGSLSGAGSGGIPARPEAVVLLEQASIEQRVLHGAARVEQRRQEREREALSQRYAAYVQSSPRPLSFEQFVELMGKLHE